jgi:transcription initiation factor TFIIE subunit alpha
MSEYRKLARLAARAIYKQTYALERKKALHDDSSKQQKAGLGRPSFGRMQQEFPGLVEIVVDALTRRQWIREDDLATALKLNPKQLRRVLRHLETLRVLKRSHVKERQALKEQRLVERAGMSEREASEAVEKKTASWCCLEYARIVDTLRFGLKGVKLELERLIAGGTFEESYACKNKEECGKRFSALDTARLFDVKRGGFVCDTCGTDVVRAGEENDEEDDGNDDQPNASSGGIAKESKQALKLRMKKFSDQIAGIERQIAKCLRYPAPSFGTLQEYVVAKKRSKEAREAAALGQAGGQGYWGSIGVARGTQAFEQRLEETTFEIQIGGENGENGDKTTNRGGDDGQEKKEMPEWITRELQVDEQGKDAKKRKVEGADAAEKEETTDADAVQEQYAKALLAALQAQQRDTTEQAKAKVEDEREKEEELAAAARQEGGDVEMKPAAGEKEEEEEEWEEA